MTLYAELMEATGHSYKIENCHWSARPAPPVLPRMPLTR
jgi:hypothetical protein